MNTKALVLAALMMSGVSAHAFSFDQRYQQSVTTIGPISIMTERGESWSRFSFVGLDSKIIRDSQDDAAYFVATNGEVRGARFVQALDVIRKHNPALAASDLDLANRIIEAR